jgi:raffinose/stachyose/melibiose transport system substrate-binding protein
MKKFLLLALAAMMIAVPMGVFAQKTTLTMYYYYDATAPGADTWPKLLDAFQQANPDIALQIETLYNEPFHQKLQAMASSDTLPDLFFMWPDKRTGYLSGLSGSKPLAKDLRPWIKGHEKEFAPLGTAAQGRNGEIFELPEQVTATHVMYTNVALLRKLGLAPAKSFAELLAQGPKIVAAGLVPIAMANQDGWQMQSCLLSTLTERAGGMAWFNKAISGKGASFKDPQFVAALDIIKQLSDRQMFAPGINTMQYSAGTDMFVNEQAPYYIDGGWKVNDLRAAMTDEQKANTLLLTIPAIPNQKGVANSTAEVAGTGFGMNAKLSGAKAAAAWKWIWFYSGPVGSKIRMEGGALPAYKVDTKGMTLDPLVVKLNEFIGKTPYGWVIDSKMDGTGMQVLHPAIQEMMFGKKTPQEVADTYEAWVAANDTARK